MIDKIFGDNLIANYNFGDNLTVKDIGKWQQEEEDHYVCVLSTEGFTEKVTFHVKFCNDEVIDVYAYDVLTGSDIGYMSKLIENKKEFTLKLLLKNKDGTTNSLVEKKVLIKDDSDVELSINIEVQKMMDENLQIIVDENLKD